MCQIILHASSVAWPKQFPRSVKLSCWWMNNLKLNSITPSHPKTIVSSPLFIIPPVNERKINQPSRCTHINTTQKLFALYLYEFTLYVLFEINRIFITTKNQTTHYVYYLSLQLIFNQNDKSSWFKQPLINFMIRYKKSASNEWTLVCRLWIIIPMCKAFPLI